METLQNPEVITLGTLIGIALPILLRKYLPELKGRRRRGAKYPYGNREKPRSGKTPDTSQRNDR